MRLSHLSLAVADQQRSRRFYETFTGFECDGELDGESCLHLTDGGGFDLTLAAAQNVSASSSLPFGIRLDEPDAVRALKTRLSAERHEAGDLYESDSRVAFHCWDPDG